MTPRNPPRPGHDLGRRHFLARMGAGTAAALLPAWAEAQTASPAARAVPGAGFEVIDLEPTDRKRARQVPLRLYLPQQASAQQPAPLVVFSHGIGGSRLGYTYLGRHWASHGLASLHLQHVGSDRSLWGSGSVFALVSRLQQAAQESEAIDRVHDLRFALDHVLGEGLGSRLDATRIVAAGHSYGANTTLLAAGARVERQGQVVDLRDERIQAAIVISAPPFYGESAALQRILAPVQLPSLHITCTEDIIRIPGYFSGLDDRLAVFAATGGTRKTLAVFQGGSHSIFTDRSSPGGPQVNQQVKAATRDLTLGFMRSILAGEHSALQDWPQRHSNLLAQFVAPGLGQT